MATNTPNRVPDVTALPCSASPEGEPHQMLPVEHKGSLRHHCAHCGQSWITLDAALRARLRRRQISSN